MSFFIQKNGAKNILTAAILCVGLLFSAGLSSGFELPDLYRKWLEEEVVYIISPVEKEVFLQLKTDRERDLFIEAFWKHRDSNLNTPGNEFRDDHRRRLLYVDQFFGKTSPLPGWRTDRGRIYIILGPPDDIQRFDGGNRVYPSEVWFYQGQTEKGLPAGFHLIFFQEGGSGPYRLYSPLSDGPQALLISYQGDLTDYVSANRRLKEVEPRLSVYTLNLIPGEESVVGGRPSMSSDRLINRIESYPTRTSDSLYARKFLEFKDLVEVEYSANYIVSNSLVKISSDPSGVNYVHYAVQPERLSVTEYQGKLVTSLVINGTVTDERGKFIYQFEKQIPLEFQPSEIDKIRARPFSFRDMFPMIPGRYRLSVLVRNFVSKEFTSIEHQLDIPQENQRPRLSSVLLGYEAEINYLLPERRRPFQFGNTRIYFHSDRVFSVRDHLIFAFQFNGFDSVKDEGTEIRYTFFRGGTEFHSFTRKPSEFFGLPEIVERVPLNEFPPSHYRLRISLFREDREIDAEEEEFDVTAETILGRPWTYTNLISGPTDPEYDFVLGLQWFNQGDRKSSRIRLESANGKNPGRADIAAYLSRVYLLDGEYAKVLPLLQPFTQGEEPADFDLLFLLGQAYQNLKNWKQAADIYRQAGSTHGFNAHLLNVLGTCFAEMGEKEEAGKVWRKSLEINPGQPEIKKKLEAIKQ